MSTTKLTWSKRTNLFVNNESQITDSFASHINAWMKLKTQENTHFNSIQMDIFHWEQSNCAHYKWTNILSAMYWYWAFCLHECWIPYRNRCWRLHWIFAINWRTFALKMSMSTKKMVTVWRRLLSVFKWFIAFYQITLETIAKSMRTQFHLKANNVVSAVHFWLFICLLICLWM